jgi:hypothetical protein
LNLADHGKIDRSRGGDLVVIRKLRFPPDLDFEPVERSNDYPFLGSRLRQAFGDETDAAHSRCERSNVAGRED